MKGFKITLENMKPILVKQENNYNFWKMLSPSTKTTYWNITPITQDLPASGYKSKEYIEGVKHQTF